jgi:uncharacterized membrane protein (DUF2068 family)
MAQDPIPSLQNATAGDDRQRIGFRLIIAYKFCKAAVMFAVALWLITAPGAAYRTLELLARDLAEGGAVFARVGHWIHEHLSDSMVIRGAALAGLDGLSSAVEGILLLSGKPWAEWIVIFGLACLIPFEILSIKHRPGITKFVVVLVNALIVAYLARVRIQKARART